MKQQHVEAPTTPTTADILVRQLNIRIHSSARFSASSKPKVESGMATHIADRNQECTVWVGGLEPQVTEEMLYELMLQAGPVVQLNLPRDAVTQLHQVSISQFIILNTQLRLHFVFCFC
jgi:RNA recognition motif-containing protein